eukprot:TRINITY_DN8271_c0_g1_i1.p2 TRINITY_DN8271_c0_g1~~TRINITY_DN8271_c0_g1_i1.p2  ORF type:complete len:224 (-),score=24.55 TRINITY_DN8271_c0_g1_i1:448-1119(-)
MSSASCPHEDSFFMVEQAISSYYIEKVCISCYQCLEKDTVPGAHESSRPGVEETFYVTSSGRRVDKDSSRFGARREQRKKRMTDGVWADTTSPVSETAGDVALPAGGRPGSASAMPGLNRPGSGSTYAISAADRGRSGSFSAEAPGLGGSTSLGASLTGGPHSKPLDVSAADFSRPKRHGNSGADLGASGVGGGGANGGSAGGAGGPDAAFAELLGASARPKR